jgi:hypothetical protein
VSAPLPADPPRQRPHRLLLTAGALQLAALFAPAVRVPLVGTIPFVRVPTAGALLIALGLLTVPVALRWNRWRWLPGGLSAAVVAIVYARIVLAPSGTFVDPLLRRAVHPAWGFAPMSLAVALSLAAASLRPRPRPLRPPMP